MEGVSRVRKPVFDPAKKSRRYNYRWWEDHVRAKMEGTDPQRPSPSNPLGQSAAAQGPMTPATPAPVFHPKW